MSGHIFFNDKWSGVDDAPYAALRVLEEVKRRKKGLVGFLENLSQFYASPEIRIDCEDDIKFSIIERIQTEASNNYKSSEKDDDQNFKIDLNEKNDTGNKTENLH